MSENKIYFCMNCSIKLDSLEMEQNQDGDLVCPHCHKQDFAYKKEEQNVENKNH